MKRTKTWVIVADGDSARLFDLPGRNAELVPLEDHVWTAPDINEYADSQGMSHSSVGPSQHRMTPRTEPDELSLDAFARVISDKLLDALRDGRYERLVLTAAPRLMGFLRNHLDPAVRETVWMEIDKDFAPLPLDKLDKALEPHLFP